MAKDEEAYISSKCRLFPTGEDSFLAYNFLSHSCQVISRNLLNILRITDHFRTVGGHKKSLIEAGWQDDGSGYIEDSITELAKRGLLVTRTSFLSHLHKTSSTDHPPRITSIVWPTRDRNQLLQRGMNSYIENNRQYSLDTRFVVLDDSRSENTSKNLQQLLASLRAQGINIRYAGLQEKLNFIEQLLYAGNAAGLPKEVVDFAFFGPNKPYSNHTFGGNLNALLLATRGQMILVTDDDMICQATVFDDRNSGLVLSSRSDPTEFHFYRNREELYTSQKFEDIDILHCHETLLGRTVSQILFQHQQWNSIDVTTASPEMVYRLMTDPMRVSATMSGVCGDSGIGSQQFLLGLKGPNRDRLMQEESIYAAAKTSHEILRHVPNTTISDSSLLMAGNLGLDNRGPLSPFFPIGRNAEGLFATILTTCYSNNLIGHLPLALLHNPTTERKISPDEFFDVRLRMTDILSLIVRTYTVPANYTDKEKRLRSLGEYLFNIGNLPLQQFEELIRLLWLESSAKKLEYLELLLGVYRSRPDFWARDVDYLKKGIKNASVEEQAYLPMDLPASHLGKEGISILRKLVADFSSLLIWWPTILRLTEELLSDNTTLARTVG